MSSSPRAQVSLPCLAGTVLRGHARIENAIMANRTERPRRRRAVCPLGSGYGARSRKLQMARRRRQAEDVAGRVSSYRPEPVRLPRAPLVQVCHPPEMRQWSWR